MFLCVCLCPFNFLYLIVFLQCAKKKITDADHVKMPLSAKTEEERKDRF